MVVPAHRLVLTTRCEVMSAMLSGAFQESTANEVGRHRDRQLITHFLNCIKMLLACTSYFHSISHSSMYFYVFFYSLHATYKLIIKSQG